MPREDGNARAMMAIWKRDRDWGAPGYTGSWKRQEVSFSGAFGGNMALPSPDRGLAAAKTVR